MAHRGASAYAPENTLAAVDLALELNADGVEIDVHVSADGRLMVMHDASTGRTCGKDWVIAQTRSGRLRLLDAGRWMGPEWAGEKIPFLEEVLERVPLDKKLFIECKTENPNLFVRAFGAVFEAHRERIEASIVISFHAPVLIALKEKYPDQAILWLVQDERLLNEYTAYIASGGAALFDGIGVDHELGISDAAIDIYLKNAHILSVWTVDDYRWIAYYKEKGFQFFTTNCPDLVFFK